MVEAATQQDHPFRCPILAHARCARCVAEISFNGRMANERPTDRRPRPSVGRRERLRSSEQLLRMTDAGRNNPPFQCASVFADESSVRRYEEISLSHPSIFYSNPVFAVAYLRCRGKEVVSAKYHRSRPPQIFIATDGIPRGGVPITQLQSLGSLTRAAHTPSFPPSSWLRRSVRRRRAVKQ